MNASTIDDIRWHRVRVSPKTVWTFVELVDADGRVGVGEATLAKGEARMREALQRFRHAVLGRAPAAVDLSGPRSLARSLPEFAVVSALDQAVWDLLARQRGISVAAALGEEQRDGIAVYANINRGIAARTPDGFALQARRAVADGFRAIKIAPFDDIELYGDTTRAVEPALLDAALVRIGAVRDAIGPDVELMVDCHWRLNRAVAENVLDVVSEQQLHWLECPVPESREMLDTLARLRKYANVRGVRLAGCETMSLVHGFAPFLDVYDVMMPDVKYVGGLREMVAVADAFVAHGVAFSPHNPSGPIAHVASLQVCAVVPTLDRLEVQYAETPLFDELVGNALPPAVQARIDVPRGPGLGARLDPKLVRTLAAE
ncbi:MAG TPA: mandelate racemase/muconate lactonizing enzyme family protein [Casimicrobiaceae bacterium]|nr:mandelate racemase/muconate lactonizing enzyme family protein [Casimicrobiaceae bacterium]